MNNNASIELSASESRHRARAEHYLAETLKILKGLETERRAHERQRDEPHDFVGEIKRILKGAK